MNSQPQAKCLALQGCLSRNNSQLSAGYTIIEMLTVVAILGIVLAIMAAAITEARSASRDKVRVADLATVEQALALYAHVHGEYPNANSHPSYPDCTYATPGISFSATGCLNVLVDEGLLQTLPADPTNSGDHIYQYDNWCSEPAGTSDGQYRMSVRTESAQDGITGGWSHDDEYGVTTCAEPT